MITTLSSVNRGLKKYLRERGDKKAPSKPQDGTWYSIGPHRGCLCPLSNMAKKKVGAASPKVQPVAKAPTWPDIAKKKGIVIQDICGDASVLVIDDVLTAKECEAIMAVAEQQGLQSTYAPPRRGYAYRDNERVLISDSAFADKLWAYLLQALLVDTLLVNGKPPAGLNADLRLYRYKAGQRFGPHIDENVQRGQHMSEYTVLFYLNGGGQGSHTTLKGGETIFHTKPPVAVSPRAGRVCIHWQQHNCLHEGGVVVAGEKWVLRSDILY